VYIIIARVRESQTIRNRTPNTKAKPSEMPFGSSSKRKRVDEEGGNADDDVRVVHDVPDDGQDIIEADDEDGAGEGIGMKHSLFDEVTIIGIPKGKMLVEQKSSA
jgi:hypothetical protein